MPETILKKLYFGLVVMMSLFLLAAPADAAQAGILINGYQLDSDVQPVVQAGQTFLPLRAVATALACETGWDQATQTATVSKDGVVVAVDLQDRSAGVNGKLVAPAGSVIVAGDRVLVPAQVLEDAFGIGVTFDTVSGNVYISDQEQVDGMSPEELLVKSYEKAQSYGTEMFEQNITMQTAGQGPSFSGTINVQGSVKQPDQAYMVESLSLPGAAGTQKIETYTVGGTVYQNLNGAGWKALQTSVSSDWLKQMSDDPSSSVKMIEQTGGIISAGTPQTLNGTTYDVVRVTMDPDKMKAWIEKMLASSAPTGQQAQVQQAIQGIFAVTQIDAAYEMFINPSTLLTERGYTTMTERVNMPPAPVTMTIHGSSRTYGFGKPVQMPAVGTGQ
ncbi:MAG TPA: copper amine oxidase N-terminal domain-containing protein [Spirochaetia bacterium]|nr:copper amine oxidase N-terminal domain-containing protein [Spirochaetia bacterium]